MSVVILIMVSIFIARILSPLFHELGHAIIGLMTFKKSIHVYLGSYGDQSQSYSFSFGRLHLNFTYNPALWIKGVCMTDEEEITWSQDFLFTIGGLIASLLVALICITYTFLSSSDSWLLIPIFFLGISGLLDFILSIFPSNNLERLDNGEKIENDGQQLKILYQQKKLYHQIEKFQN